MSSDFIEGGVARFDGINGEDGGTDISIGGI
jgi:hypothetical protein